MPDTQYFTNIDGKYVKDAEARQQLNDLEDYVESLDQPWQPLQDGYSNFWFELTNDTLSPWLNFSAKTENAVIDWGDGSGEQSLTTLTPTHTYSKAGRYVVKVKGVTGTARIYTAPYNAKYCNALIAVELNSEVTDIAAYSYINALGLKHFVENSNVSVSSGIFQNAGQLYNANFTGSISTISNNMFVSCLSLTDVNIPSGVTSIGAQSFNSCINLATITIPQTVTEILITAFNSCVSLSEVHCQATNPPTLGTNAFAGLPANWLCYVPVGTAETYKAASGWSTYADHILEEGQTPNRMMLAKFNSAKTEEVKDDELHQDENR